MRSLAESDLRLYRGLQADSYGNFGKEFTGAGRVWGVVTLQSRRHPELGLQARIFGWV